MFPLFHYIVQKPLQERLMGRIVRYCDQRNSLTALWKFHCLYNQNMPQKRETQQVHLTNKSEIILLEWSTQPFQLTFTTSLDGLRGYEHSQ